jgi:hypothetical protein
VHRDTLEGRPKAAFEHLPVGAVPSHIHAGLKARQPLANGQRFTSVEEPIEPGFGRRSGGHRPELDGAGLISCFGAATAMTNREACQSTVIRQQYGIAEFLRVHRALRANLTANLIT